LAFGTVATVRYLFGFSFILHLMFMLSFIVVIVVSGI
jgi:hypothetical protein